MTYRIERLASVYSMPRGEHEAWRPVLAHNGEPLHWGTMREATGFVQLITSHNDPVPQYRVVEVSHVEG